MNILLVNPLLAPDRTPETCNLGLAYIASALRQDGHRLTVLDLDARRMPPERVREVLAKTDFDAAGIGTLVSGFRSTRWLTRQIRELKPQAHIWVGNSIATPIPEVILREMPVDVVALGEGEATVRELARATERGEDLSSVAGIVYRGPGGPVATAQRPVIADIDSIPMPAWDLFQQDVYTKSSTAGMPGPKMYVITTRGCPYRCTYCYHPFQNVKVRFHSAERVVAEIAELQGRYGVRSIHFGDDLFVVDKKRVYEICDLMEKRRVKVLWSAASRVNTLDEDMLKRMKSAGCVVLGFGIQSGSQTILDNIKKRTTVAQGLDAVRLCRKVGIEAACSFMIGNVGETPETVAASVDFIKRADLPPTVFFFTTPYPGTELYEHGRAAGLIKDEVALFESYGEQNDQFLVNFTGMTDAELLRVKKAAEDRLLVDYGRRHPLRWLRHMGRHLRHNVRNYGWAAVLRRIVRRLGRLVRSRP